MDHLTPAAGETVIFEHAEETALIDRKHVRLCRAADGTLILRAGLVWYPEKSLAISLSPDRVADLQAALSKNFGRT